MSSHYLGQLEFTDQYLWRKLGSNFGNPNSNFGVQSYELTAFYLHFDIYVLPRKNVIINICVNLIENLETFLRKLKLGLVQMSNWKILNIKNALY